MSTKKLNTANDERIDYDSIIFDLDFNADFCGGEYHIDDIVDRFLLDEFKGETDLYSAIMTSVFGTLDGLNRADTMEMVESVAKEHREDLQYYTDLRMSATGGFNQNPLEAVVCGAQDVIYDALQTQAQNLAIAAMAFHIFDAFGSDTIPESAWELALRIVSTYDLENVKANQIISDAQTIASLGDAKEQKPRNETYDALNALVQDVLSGPPSVEDDEVFDRWCGGHIVMYYEYTDGTKSKVARISETAVYFNPLRDAVEEIMEEMKYEEAEEFDYT